MIQFATSLETWKVHRQPSLSILFHAVYKDLDNTWLLNYMHYLRGVLGRGGRESGENDVVPSGTLCRGEVLDFQVLRLCGQFYMVV